MGNARQEATGNLWDRRPQEPSRWFERFELYRALGPNRTLQAAFDAYWLEQGKARNAIARPGQAWHQAARCWQWRERAEAFDDAERARLRATEAERRFDARLRRLAIVEQLREEVFSALQAAKLTELTELEAREMVGSLRIFLKDLLLAERLEYGEATEIVEQPEAAATIAGEVERMLEKAYGGGVE